MRHPLVEGRNDSRSRWSGWVLAVAAVCSAGCTAPTEPEPPAVFESIGSLGQPISGGTIDAADTSVVGIVIYNGGSGFGGCTGTLIAPNVVLTAHHCVAKINTGGAVDCVNSKFYSPYPASTLYVTTKTTFPFTPTGYRTTKQVLVQPGSAVCGNDVAILVLNEAIPSDEAVPRVPRVDSSPASEEAYYAIGYGELSDGGNNSGTRYRRDGLKVKCVGTDCHAGGYITKTELLGDTGVCQGDSGGPASDLADRVFGVASRGAAGCQQPVYSDVFGFGEFIKQSTVNATQAAGVPIPDWALGVPTDPIYHYPVGDACAQPTDCKSNACLAGTCTRVCTQQAPCPIGWLCGSNGFCQKPPAPVGSGGGEEEEVVSACSMSRGQDPTKPIPWIVSLAAAVALGVRRRVARR
jgi:hypothetical protein